MSAAVTFSERQARVGDVVLGGRYRNVLSGRVARVTHALGPAQLVMVRHRWGRRELMSFRELADGWEPVIRLWGAR